MHPHTQTLIDLETRFWQSIVDNDTHVALELLTEPSIVVGPRGAAQLRHEDYRRVVEHGPDSLQSFELSNVQVTFPNDATALVTYHARLTRAPRANAAAAHTLEVNDSSTWVRSGSGWKCVMHTETPAGA
jgi:hypothetical protein